MIARQACHLEPTTLALQDEALGPFLHQLVPEEGENVVASKAQAEQEAQLLQVGVTVGRRFPPSITFSLSPGWRTRSS